MSDAPVDTRFAFQPLVNLHTGGVVAMEMLARPPHGDVRTLLWSAARAGRLEKLDMALAVAAAHHSSTHETLLPLHLNLLADTIVGNGEPLAPLDRALDRTGRRPSETVLDVNPPYAAVEPALLLTALRRFRRRGYRIALDGVGSGCYPLNVLAEAGADLIKLDQEIVAGLPGERGCLAVLEALAQLAHRLGAQLVAEGVERAEQLATLRQHGVGIAQGNLLAPPSRRPLTFLPDSTIMHFQPPVSPVPSRDTPGSRITDFMHPALTLPVDATAENVRTVLGDRPSVTGVVLLDSDGKPCYTLDRNRFLLAVSGAYGHALHARRDAARLGDPPRVLAADSSALAALELVRSSEPHRMYDDIVVVGPTGRCEGGVRIGDVVRGVAEMNAEQAAALHPLTRLPGSDVVAELVDRRVAARQIFTVSWLDVDDFGAINDSGGFTAGDDLIRELGRALTDAADTLGSAEVAHIGGDDFVVVCDLDDVVPFGSAVLDQSRIVEGREVALSLASLVCAPGTVAGHRDVSRMLAQLRRRAKSMPGTSWVFGRPGTDRVDILRGPMDQINTVVTPQQRPAHRPLRTG
ncbi:MAG TPA: GGDEF domain-containing protein [Pseudonocardiaceae bacterium]|nr:GGDEF domain-containing protein [Pseudonocardiaceae bacterium]